MLKYIFTLTNEIYSSFEVFLTATAKHIAYMVNKFLI